MPDRATLHAGLKQKGVTLQLLWIEYKRQTPDGYQSTQFCQHCRTWADTLEPAMRQVHVAGETTFVDYAGLTVAVHEAATDTVREAQIFVGALGASHLLFAEPTWTQTLPDWIGSHVRMLEYIGAVSALIVPDNLKSGVTSPCHYEPIVHATYQDFATHCGTAILPARVRHPRDMAKVETAVQIVEREILAPLRHDVFNSLAELAHAITYALERVNTRPFQKLAGSRRSVFEATERTTLRPLPPTPYELCTWRSAKVNIDYHISVEGHCYSVPYRLTGATVTVRLTASMVEILHRGTRVAVQARGALKGRFTTEPSHRSKAHDRHVEWTPSRLIAWGMSIGPATGQFVEGLLARYAHPEQSYRICLGLFALKRRYDAARLEAACRRACDAGTISHRSVKSILATGLDSPPLEGVAPTTHLPPRTRMSAARPTTTPPRRSSPSAGSGMLIEQTLTTLHALKLLGMATSLDEQCGQPDLAALAFDERLALLLEREQAVRHDHRLTRFLQLARLHYTSACLEDVNFRTKRGLEKSRVLQLADGDWIRQHQTLLVVGPTGTGKSWLACALGHVACRQGHTVRYLRLPRLLSEDLVHARADGSQGS